MELIWRNRSDEIEQQLERMRYILRVQFGHKVNLVRLCRYCNIIYSLLLICCLTLFLLTIYNHVVTDTALLLFYAIYSEAVLLMRLSNFTLYAVLILVFYMELREVSFRLILELDKTRFEVWSLRRLSLERLAMVQHLHGLLWNTVRSIERNFELSLVIVMLKYFVDTSVLPYWILVNRHNHINISTTYYCATEEICKLMGLFVASFICTRCALLQRQLRSIFHGLTTDRQNAQLNADLYRISGQLGQERFEFSAGGLMVINNETLGKFIFGMVSYIIICIQFRLTMISKSPAEAVENFVTDAQLP
ncbi:uncharacterized protein Dvir_GJ22630 [Drosophila virilis]|uniref:Gustatory receptor n=1 Tax=Drosophila virilis TaxID=7244 RepID=B4M026_DROVI|nr:uncharacterized protein Dvir_GJ22630 [Drosophila virilis]